jgi:hypothetical protein
MWMTSFEINLSKDISLQLRQQASTNRRHLRRLY